MKAKFFERVLFTSMVLSALTMTSVLCGGGRLAFAQPSPQTSPTTPVQTGQSPEPQRASGDSQTSGGAVDKNDEKPSKSPREEVRRPQREDYWMAGGILLVLAFLFFLLIHYSSRIENSNYLGTVFRDTVEEAEFTSLAAGHRQKWENRGYHAHALQDPEVQQRITEAESKKANAPQESSAAPRTGSGGGTGIGMTRTGTGTGYHEEVEKQARLNYNKDLDKARQKAADRANRAGKVDLNVLRGRGPEFVLEFTAVVVLVFAVVILGLLLILESQPIATLLAAIAGYVLGRASTRKQGGEGEGIRAGVSTAEVIELVRAVTGVTKPAGKAPPKEPEEQDDVSSSAPVKQPVSATSGEEDKTSEDVK